MSLWNRSISVEGEAVKRSAKLRKQLDELEAQLPVVQAKWDRADLEEVLPAAERLAAAGLSQNPERLLAARNDLQRCVWRRDEVRDAHRRKFDELASELAMITAPVVSAKVLDWQRDLLDLSKHRMVEIADKQIDMTSEHTPKLVRVRSNLAAIASAREALTAAIRELREMTGRPLGEINQHIEKVETRLRAIDLGEMKTAKEAIPLSAYLDVVNQDGVQIVDPRSIATQFFRQ